MADAVREGGGTAGRATGTDALRKVGAPTGPAAGADARHQDGAPTGPAAGTDVGPQGGTPTGVPSGTDVRREDGSADAPGPAAVRAFGASAGAFDERFGRWGSVAAQRRAVRRHLLEAFPRGSRLLELGGGTGEDALFLARRGYRVLLTDGAPEMVERAAGKVAREGLGAAIRTGVLPLEDMEAFARDRRARGEALLDGAYSNFAALNCVEDLRPVARGLARVLRPGAPALLVVFGPFPPGELLVQLLRGDPRAAVRRLRRGSAPARLGGVPFRVWYPGPRQVARAFEPEFRVVRARGIGVFVPPSAAEPAISSYPGLLAALERLDRLAEGPLAWLGDHVLLHLERSDAPAPDGAAAGGSRGAGRSSHGTAADGSRGAGRSSSHAALADGSRGAGRSSSYATPAGGSQGAARPSAASRRFRAAYADQRRAEGRGAGGEAELLALPYLRTGPQAPQWAVRSRTYDRFVAAVLRPLARAAAPRPLHLLDLGAGNAWLSHRLIRLGHRATALDVRTDAVDGLGAAAAFGGHPAGVPPRVAASFEALPLESGTADVAVFNASLHYAVDLAAALGEAARCVAPAGRVVVLDSPFYADAADGEAMVAEKRREADGWFGARAADLMAPPFVEYLTRERLDDASAGAGLRWRRHRVRYPLAYEARPVLARLRGARRPSRFDVWEGRLS